MTNKVAFILAAMIVAFLLVDIIFLHGSNLLFLAKQFTALIEYISFWR